MGTISQRCTNRSINDTTQAALGNTSCHSWKLLLVVTTVLLFCKRPANPS
jgi:hypothetical protein